MTTDASGRDVASLIGARHPRVEDPHLLSGRGRFTDDLRGDARAVAFVRAEVAGAELLGVDADEALALPGVHAVLVDADLDLRPLEAVLDRPDFHPTEMPVLARGWTRHVGDPVALVVADDPYRAEDAAELVRVELGPAEPVGSMDRALAEDAPVVMAGAPSNVLLDVALDAGDVDAGLGAAAVVVEATFSAARVNATPLEARATRASWDPRDGRLTVHTSTQIPHLVRSAIATTTGLAEGRIRVVAPDVGGGFGQKCVVAREELAVAAAAHALRGCLAWAEDRRENLLAAPSGHEQDYHARAGFDPEGRLLAVDLDIRCDVGSVSAWPFTCGVEPLMAMGEFPNAYRLPAYRARARAIATHKPMTAPYRGVSRPQICLVMERLLDKAAVALDLDPADVRRANLVTDDDFPYTGISAVTYDRGSYRESLEVALQAVGWDDRAERASAAAARGRVLGMGLSCFSERTGYGTPTFAARNMDVTPGYDTAVLAMDPTGMVTVAVGASAHGQSHATTLAQVVAAELGLSVADVRVVEGDTDTTPYGFGTFASRGAVVTGGACARVAAACAERLRVIAAEDLEVDPDDVVLADGRAAVVGAPDRSVAVADLARRAHHQRHLLPDGLPSKLEFTAEEDPPGTFSNATHVAVVEVDPGTGQVEVVDYVVAEDCGVVINPMVVDGQVLGGVAQGIGCALFEQLDHDERANPTTSTFLDYLLPTSAEVPTVAIHHLETPSEFSVTGAKGMGEGGLIGAPAAIANAVSAALGTDVDSLPITPADVVAALAALERPEVDPGSDEVETGGGDEPRGGSSGGVDDVEPVAEADDAATTVEVHGSIELGPDGASSPGQADGDDPREMA